MRNSDGRTRRVSPRTPYRTDDVVRMRARYPAAQRNQKIAEGIRQRSQRLDRNDVNQSLSPSQALARRDEVKIDGVIFGTARSSFSVETAGGVVSLRLTEETTVLVFGHEGSLADMRVGLTVAVRAARTRGPLVALIVEIEDQFDLVELDGVIASVSPSRIVVVSSDRERIPIALTGRTFVMWRRDLLSVSDLDAGMRAEIKAFRDRRGTLAALRIRLNDETPGSERILV